MASIFWVQNKSFCGMVLVNICGINLSLDSIWSQVYVCQLWIHEDKSFSFSLPACQLGNFQNTFSLPISLILVLWIRFCIYTNFSCFCGYVGYILCYHMETKFLIFKYCAWQHIISLSPQLLSFKIILYEFSLSSWKLIHYIFWYFNLSCFNAINPKYFSIIIFFHVSNF